MAADHVYGHLVAVREIGGQLTLGKIEQVELELRVRFKPIHDKR